MRVAETPRLAVHRLLDAIREHNLEAALELFEKDAILAMLPDKLGQGEASIRTFLTGIFEMKGEFRYEAEHFLESGDLALYTAKWSITSTISRSLPVPRASVQSIVLRKQPAGNWLIAIDNPWGPHPKVTLPPT